DAVQIDEKAQKGCRQSSVEERTHVLQGAYDYLNENREDIVQLMNRESGSTILKANLEIDLSLAELQEAIGSADELYKVKELYSGIEGKVNKVHRLPLGVIS